MFIKPLLVKHITRLCYFFVLSVAFSLTAQTKKDLHFYIQYSPETIYQQSLTQSATNLMRYTGNKEFRENLESKGIKNPNITETKSNTETEYTTGKLKSDSTFFMTLKFLSTDNTTGKKQIPDGTLIYGHGSLTKIPVFDSIESAEISAETKTMLLQVLQSTFSQLSLPEQHLNVGEKFKTVTPLSIPIAGVTLNMEITTHYKLINIENSIARFAITQEYTMTSTITKFVIKATGEGKGILLYDNINHFYKSYEVNSKMEMNLEAEGFGIELTSSSNYLQTIKITH